nr:MAG TPA: hypothetical protein [Caudoviricetes sp.]
MTIRKTQVRCLPRAFILRTRRLTDRALEAGGGLEWLTAQLTAF